MNKIFTLLIACCFLIFGGACFTPALYNDSIQENMRQSTDELRAVLITQDGQQTIAVGKQHHYIFPANETLKFILGWKDNKRVELSINTLIVRNDDSLMGSYVLEIADKADLSTETRKVLLTKGFTEAKKRNSLIYYGDIRGQRYSSDKFELPQAMTFAHPYSINVTEYSIGAGTVVKRTLLTPLAVVGDGLLILGGVLVSPLLLLGH